MGYQFYITDVFTNNKYKGNQLATVILEEELPTSKMQEIAREFNFSESTFVLRPQINATNFDVRIFTPSEEIPFAGHPTLGTAYLMWQYYNGKNDSIITLSELVGEIPVDTSSDTLWMTQKKATFGEFLTSKDASALLDIPINSIRTDLPIQIVSTGLPALIIPLVSMDAVLSAKPSQNFYYELAKRIGLFTIYTFSEETYSSENQLNARVYADMNGIIEDPATGSATGSLGGYLNKHTNKDIDLCIEQGFEIGRDSILHLKVKNGVIKVGGSVKLVAKGELL